MTEHQRGAPERPAAERYYAQHATLGVGPGVSSAAALQEAINEGARQSWKLISTSRRCGASASTPRQKPCA